MSDFIFKHGDGKKAYSRFRAASRRTLNLATFAHRLHLDLAQDPEHVEQVALEMARHGRLTVYLDRDGRISDVGVPWQPSE